MTLEEAKVVAAICGTADGGCPNCVTHLMHRLKEAFPQFVWYYDESRDLGYEEHLQVHK